MSVLGAVLIGLIHGVCEMLPLSSSGHISAIDKFFDISIISGSHLLFDFLLHLGTLAAVCVVYWQEIIEMIYEGLGVFNLGPYTAQKRERYPAARQLLMLLVSSLPLVYILVIWKYIPVLYENTYFSGTCLVLTGLIIFAGEKIESGKKTGGNMSVLDALIIGICQSVSAIPGISRTAVTVSAGKSVGLRYDYAIRFSFLLYIPAAFGYCITSLVQAVKVGIDWHCLPAYLVGTAVSIVASVFILYIFKKLTDKGKAGGLAYYCWIVGVLVIILTLIF